MSTLAATAAILAGGQSRRMGEDKALLRYRGTTLIQGVANALTPVFDEVLVSVNDPARYPDLALPVVRDRRPNDGPLAALASVLAVARHDAVALVACDIVTPDMDLLRELLHQSEGADGALPRCENRIQPLFAVYRRDRVSTTVDTLLTEGKRAMRDLIAAANFSVLPVAPGRIRNINTRADYLALNEQA